MAVDETYETANYEAEDGTSWVINGIMEFGPDGRMVNSAGEYHIAIADVPEGGLANSSDNAYAINQTLEALRGVGVIDT